MDILILFGLIALNGLFAMSEIALVAAKGGRLRKLAEQFGSAQTALKLKGRSHLVSFNDSNWYYRHWYLEWHLG